MIKDAHVLIVGGAGFVGSNLVKMLLSPKIKIHVIDNLLSAERFNVPEAENIIFTEGSISDDDIVGNLVDEYDYVFHLATYHGNQSSIHDPLADHENNTLTSLKLFNKLKTFKRLKKVVYSSAGCSVAEKTFGDAKPSKEVDIVSLDMDSPYSISKIIGEFYAKYYFKQHQLPVVRVRFQNVFGPGEVLGAGKWRGTPATVWRNVTPTFIYKALKKMSLPLENNGVATRDFIYVDDICRGLIQAARLGKTGDVYNLASGKEISIRELAETINQLTGNTSPIEHLPKRSWDHSGKRFGCPLKAEQEICFKAATDFYEGMKTTIAWTQNNLALIEKTIDKHKKYL
ncbi:MAG: NAD-dependent epimerase/dehydratase family protein [Parachlamydiales bacterium]|nr:NAD-dependent epimerase/dehydratase family protein [Parachlamydiales bacterium]